MKLIKTSVGQLFASPFPLEAELQEFGPFDMIWNLTKEYPDPNQHKYAAEVMNGLIPDMSIPYDMVLFKNQLGKAIDALKNNKKILVHCLGGKGRTGMAVCLIKQELDKLSPEAALEFSLFHCNGPETYAQTKFVLDYHLNQFQLMW